MAKFTRNFLAGRMNKVMDERVVPAGEYIDALNIRMGSTENSEYGVIENSKGNMPMTALAYYDGTPLSADARCIGAIEDSARETIYWFVHDSNFTASPTGKLDLIMSINVFSNIVTYHIISTKDPDSLINTTLNFNDKFLITGVSIIGDLLFFTDDYNAPRFINVTRSYPVPVGYVDDPLLAESILVIKRPPTEAPIVTPISTSGEENYLEERFICFAYRYKYADGEYSAISQWSAPAFIPSEFNFSADSSLNEGMVNSCNACEVKYRDGGELVVSTDLLFKSADSNIIKVIDKFDTVAFDSEQTYVFTNSKIFTILPQAELLRLYDNVPRFAKAQTIMGNRLMYGNYVEGYDLIDKNGYPVQFDYTTDLISNSIGLTDIPSSADTGSYNINGPESIPDSVVNIDLSGVVLAEGGLLSVDIAFRHNSFTGDGTPSMTTSDITINFSFYLPTTYSSVYAMATSPEFQSAVGTALNIKPVYDPLLGPTSCDGTTLTDKFNCSIPNSLAGSPSVLKYASGINADNEAIAIYATPLYPNILLQLLAMRFVDDLTTPTYNVYEYYEVIYSEVSYQDIANTRSLHSNRGYEIGIVYMDDYNRATTALVSTLNNVHVPCSKSAYKNSIQVTIPYTQVAPAWAKRYKFVIKPDTETYEVIYSNIFFIDALTNQAYFLLEGENSRKVEQGDRLIVKADSAGPTTSCVYATVLEKASKQAGFITTAGGVDAPAGVYMKMNPNDFSLVIDENAVIAPGSVTVTAGEGSAGPIFPVVRYKMNQFNDSTSLWVDYDVPAGSRIILDFKFVREGTGNGDNSCERRKYTLSKTMISSASYNNMYDWWIGDNVEGILDDGTQEVGGTGNCPINNTFIPTITNSMMDIPGDLCVNYYRFFRDLTTQQLMLMVTGTNFCEGVGSKKRHSSVTVNIQVFRSDNTLIFETEPIDAQPDVFFENNLSFPIDVYGNHLSNGATGDQSQDIALETPAIIQTDFFNCFAFGNGAESYKIRDSLVGRSFNLGNRVFSVSAQDYKEANRFADVTYSGVYNNESNVNKLNEFNLGLLNFKPLEVSFGDIYIMDGRETDILVLQEDKISYVLTGKNLLSDAGAGSAITSVPEVLGTQIARTEKYGISFNPESYVQWGYDRYFTDAKRGAVLQLQGNAYSNEQLKVISEQNMRTWFRDVFNQSFNTQKLGGFDPYMNEYVLTTNDRRVPIDVPCVNCDNLKTLTLSQQGEEELTFSYCVYLGSNIGTTEVEWWVAATPIADPFEVKVVYDSIEYSSGSTTTNGNIIFARDLVTDDVAYITIVYTGDVTLTMNAKCPIAEQMKIVEVVVTNNTEGGESIHAEFRYTIDSFVSPLQSNLVNFAFGSSNPLVSRYNLTTGFIGSPFFPPNGSTMILRSNKIGSDTFDFDPLKDKFRYLRTSVLYDNNPLDIGTLLGLALNATPISGGPTNYYSSFIVPDNTVGEYLYLIWDFRSILPITLCYSEDNPTDVCCDCVACASDCIQLSLDNTHSSEEAYIDFPSGICVNGSPTITPVTIILEPGELALQCVKNAPWEITSGNPIITILDCNCP